MMRAEHDPIKNDVFQDQLLGADRQTFKKINAYT